MTACPISVWGGPPPANGNGALQAYVSHLRRRLEPDATAWQRGESTARAGPGYVLVLAPDAVDAWAFEAAVEAAAGQAPGEAVCTLETALRMWRGPAYADYAGEAWAEAEVARLTELRGSRARAAARDAARARAVLADELGVDPGLALRALEAEVLAQSPDLDGPRPAATTAPPTLIQRPRTAGGLVVGTSGCLLVEGRAGIGTTRLLDEVRRPAVAAGVWVRSARTSALEHGIAQRWLSYTPTHPRRQASCPS